MRSWLCLALLCVLLPLVAYGSSAPQTVQISDAANGVTLLQQDDNGLRLRLDVGTINIAEVITKKGAYSVVAAQGLTGSKEIGEPFLPTAGNVIAIPLGCKLSAEVIHSDVEEIKLSDLGFDMPVMPAQPSVSKSEDPESLPFMQDEGTYQMSGFYQPEMVVTREEGIMRGVRMGHVEINPFEYSPSENILRVHKNIEVRINFDNADWGATDMLFDRYYSPVFEPVWNKAINYEDMFAGSKANLLTYPIGYIIIADRMFEDQLQPFIEWKTRKGFEVHVAYFDVISNDRTAVHNYLDSLYTNMVPAPSMALIVGDAQQLDPYSGTAGSHVTDLYFFEFTDDLFPEMWYGRFSAQTTAQLQPQIDKTLEYEMYQMPDPSYLGEVTMVSGVDGTYASTYGNGQINYGTNYYFNLAHGIDPHVWLYPASDASGAAAAIIQTISDGVGFYNYTAHCSHSGHADPSFTTSDIPGLTNYSKYLLGIGNCCQSNTFDESTPCFGEAFLQVEGKGGIGYIGGSNSTYWDEDYWWGVGAGDIVGSGPDYEDMGPGAYDGIFHDHGEAESAWYIVNGAILSAGSFAVTEAGSSRETYYWEIYHLMGDPSVMTYLGVPEENNVVHDATLLMTATNITVTADPASYVGITFDGELKGAGYVDASGQVTIPLTSFGIPGEAEIVVTAQFKQPYFDTIQVITPSGPYVVYDYADFGDALGNNNGIIDAGESISLGLGLVNVGPDDALGVVGHINTDDEYLTITDSTESYGTIVGDNGTGYVVDGYAFDVAGNAPDGHRAIINLEVTGTARDSWFGTFQVPIHAPNLSVLYVAIDDSEGGDNNGILDPGETADLTVTLQNSGSGQAFGVNVTVSETDSYVEFGNTMAYYGSLDSAGGTANNYGSEFDLTANSECPLGYAVPVTVDVTGDNGFNTTLSFNVTVGDRVVFYSDDFSYDQGWTGLGGSAEWEIGPTVGTNDDPAEDHSPTTDNQVLGNDLGGAYNASISSTQWVYSPIIDCGTMTGVQMTYYHWLGVESSSYDHAYFDVYDGESWIRLFENDATNQETEWTYEFYDLSEVADSNSYFQLRWGLGSTDGSIQQSGWNIDDIEIKGYGRIGMPDMEMEAGPFADSLQPGASATHYMTFRNTGDGSLRVWLESDNTWLEFSTDVQLILPGDSAVVEVVVNGEGLECGEHLGSIHYTSNDNGDPEGNISFTALIYAPDVSVIETSLSETLESGQESTYELTINNNGPGRLDYTAGCFMNLKDKTATAGLATSSSEPIAYRPGDADKSDYQEPIYAPIEKGSGGPDVFGHSWIDSDESGGPALDYMDISTVGTAITLGDDEGSEAISIGFGFPFYDSVYTELYIGSNGIISFDESLSSRVNGTLPSSVAKAIIAMFWDDLDPRRGGEILYYHDVANGRFIVSFDEIMFYYSTTGTGSLSFQAQLYENGSIQLHYGTMETGERDFLSHTIGLQNSEQSDALEIVNNAAYMHSDLAIEIVSSHWLSIVPAGGSIDPFGFATITVGYSAIELEDGEYTGQILISSNDPDTPSLNIPVTLTVEPELVYVCGDVDGSGSGPDINDLVYLVTYMFGSGPVPPVMAAADVDGEPGITIADLVHLATYMFQGGDDLNCVE
ncbi:MAG TPA: C25 family cysteine peptidase [candidate division Zixibacteria bacterium]|nr:C25 family cysteine peptidase [candidate division Zixibacteria bacterium]